MTTANHVSVSSERAIANLIASYAFLNDDADIAGLGELFADAVCTLDGTTARGRHEVETLARPSSTSARTAVPEPVMRSPTS